VSKGTHYNYTEAHPFQIQLATEKFSVEAMVADALTADLILGSDFL